MLAWKWFGAIALLIAFVVVPYAKAAVVNSNFELASSRTLLVWTERVSIDNRVDYHGRFMYPPKHVFPSHYQIHFESVSFVKRGSFERNLIVVGVVPQIGFEVHVPEKVHSVADFAFRCEKCHG